MYVCMYVCRKLINFFSSVASPKVRTKITLADRLLSCAAPQILEPSSIYDAVYFQSKSFFFKNRLKTFLFSKAFNQEFQHCKLRFYFSCLINFVCKVQLNIFIETAWYKFLLIIIIIINAILGNEVALTLLSILKT